MAVVQGHPRSSILVPIESPYATFKFLLVINSNFGHTNLPTLDSITDLGVTYDSRLSFSLHKSVIESSVGKLVLPR